MRVDINRELISYLSAVHTIERQGLQLLTRAIRGAGDERIVEIYRGHCRQTEAHLRTIVERLQAHDPDGQTSFPSDTECGLAAIGIRFGPNPPGESPAMFAMATYAYENLEIAAYHLLRGIADRAGDGETIAAVDRILEEEEQAAETLASTFDRALELSLGEAPGTPSAHQLPNPTAP